MPQSIDLSPNDDNERGNVEPGHQHDDPADTAIRCAVVREAVDVEREAQRRALPTDGRE
ncbi:hypothetical protein D3C85_1494420 [compost metagenome]